MELKKARVLRISSEQVFRQKNEKLDFKKVSKLFNRDRTTIKKLIINNFVHTKGKKAHKKDDVECICKKPIQNKES